MSCCIVISCSSNITTLPVYPVIEFATITGNGDSVAAPQIALDLLNIGGTFNNFDGFTRKTAKSTPFYNFSYFWHSSNVYF